MTGKTAVEAVTQILRDESCESMLSSLERTREVWSFLFKEGNVSMSQDVDLAVNSFFKLFSKYACEHFVYVHEYILTVRKRKHRHKYILHAICTRVNNIHEEISLCFYIILFGLLPLPCCRRAGLFLRGLAWRFQTLCCE